MLCLRKPYLSSEYHLVQATQLALSPWFRKCSDGKHEREWEIKPQEGTNRFSSVSPARLAPVQLLYKETVSKLSVDGGRREGKPFSLMPVPLGYRQVRPEGFPSWPTGTCAYTHMDSLQAPMKLADCRGRNERSEY